MGLSAITSAELACIAGVEPNTVKKIAGELLGMLRRDVEAKGQGDRGFTDP